MVSPAVPSAGAAPPASSSTPAPADWTVQIADTVVGVVDSVRDKTAVPLETIARAVVYGIVIAVVGIASLVLVTIALVRAGTYVLPVWAVDGILGGLFTLAGLLLWRKRRSGRPSAN